VLCGERRSCHLPSCWLAAVGRRTKRLQQTRSQLPSHTHGFCQRLASPSALRQRARLVPCLCVSSYRLCLFNLAEHLPSCTLQPADSLCCASRRAPRGLQNQALFFSGNFPRATHAGCLLFGVCSGNWFPVEQRCESYALQDLAASRLATL